MRKVADLNNIFGGAIRCRCYRNLFTGMIPVIKTRKENNKTNEKDHNGNGDKRSIGYIFSGYCCC